MIAGDIIADIECEVNLHADATISIDGSLTGDIAFTSTTEDQIKGQIIINAGDAGGEWNGGISIDGVTLTGPNYTETSADIGGGAVGLAPFNFHATNCVPADNTTATTQPDEAVLSHYGPVEKSGTGTELKIVRHLSIIGCAVCEDVTSDFEWTYSTLGREITITPKTNEEFEDNYEYHITPVVTGGTILRCQDVTGNPAVQSYNYNFKVDF